MKNREIVFWIYGIALIIGVFSTLSIPQEAWKYISDAQKGIFGFQILLGICGVLIAYWISEDGQENESHQRQFRKISDRLNELEKQTQEEKQN